MQLFTLTNFTGLFSIFILYILYRYFRLKKRSVDKEERKNHPEDYIKNIPKEIYSKLDFYNLRHYWYPVQLSEYLTKEKPHGFKLLGEPLVLYRDKDGKVVCAQDLCPHRSAKLSLGTMRNGNVECMYHGWQFGSNGQCEKIPSIPKDNHMEKNVCLKTKPCIEDLGVIFVWVGPPSLAHDSLVPRFMFREKDFNGWEFGGDYYDLDFPHDFMVDNLLDQAHVDFTHDGTIGKRSLASHVQYLESSDKTYTSVSPLAFSYDASKPDLEREYPKSNFTFIPPSFVKLRIEVSKGKFLYQNLTMIPTEKNKMRLLIAFHQTMIPHLITDLLINSKLGLHFIRKSMKKVVMQDNELLIQANENVNEYGAKAYSKIVNSDIMIKRYRDEFFDKAMKKDPWFKGYNVDIEDLK